MQISSKYELEKAAIEFGILPFFRNKIIGFSVQELAAPGKLFGLTDDDDGCWEWKGPVIQEQTTAYGKFFNKKAGFVSKHLLPDFLNYRRYKYPVAENSIEHIILDIVKSKGGTTSSELRSEIFGKPVRKRRAEDLVDLLVKPTNRHSIEGPLQRLQMGGHLLIADFEYKFSRQGKRIGWGVALYSTPELWFEENFKLNERTPEESFDFLVKSVKERLREVPRSLIENLLR